jgi:hypothetical protein
MPEPKPPTMNRSRGQLATVYAPHSLFTFEGGTGACMARPVANPPYESFNPTTKPMIHEQIIEFIGSWLRRATAGRDTVVPVCAERALDPRALREGSIHLPLAALHFQVPERVGYVPFPAAFVCTKCSLHRHCEEESNIAKEMPRFREACPNGRDSCADDWQQLDVVMAHWSGNVEALTPLRRYVNPTDLTVGKISSCATCGASRFYLRRAGSTFSRWRFECVECHTPREIRLEDRDTLEMLKQPLSSGQNVIPQINMEAVSYRASAVYYAQGDRLLVFGDDRWISLLQNTNAGALSKFLATQYGFPLPAFDEAERERAVRDAGRGKEWEGWVQMGALIKTIETTAPDAAALLRQQRAVVEANWNDTVLAARSLSPGSLVEAVDGRQQFVRRFDPIRMAVEHKTLLEERLRAGATLADGRALSVDVTRPDDFMLPDSAIAPASRATMIAEITRRLRVLGVSEMRLLRGLQVCEYTFGFTRTSSVPTVRREKAGSAEMPVRLNLFARVRVGDNVLHPVLCLEQANEAFYVRLDERLVLAWLARNSIAVPTAAAPNLGGRLIEEYPPLAFSRFLDEYRREKNIARSAYPHVYTLLHTFAHHLITVAAAMSGLDLGSFGEHVFVPDLAILVYRRGMTMDLGNLSSMWRDRSDPVVGNEVLDRMVSPESLRCGSETVCTHQGGACPDCILIPETACLTRNELLSRSVLAGRGAPRWDANATPLVSFYEVAAQDARSTLARP